MNTWYFFELLVKIIAVALVISLHEFAHAFIAVKNGDNTPKLNNRYTLNPVSHFDLIGFISMILVGFGWAKPVPINPNNFKNKRKGIITVSSAGIIANYIFAFICLPLLILAEKYLPNLLLFDDLIVLTLSYGFSLNLCLFVFNLLPIFPLDGFLLLFSIFPSNGKIFKFLAENGYKVLFVLICLSFVSEILLQYNSIFKYLNIFGYFMSFSTKIMGWPIIKFWSLFF